MTFEDACYDKCRQLAELVIKKQHDYGHGNINAFGEIGIKVRTSDKKERLKNLLDKIDDTFESKTLNESFEDSWWDMGGYSILALMYLDGTFQLELKGEE